MSSLHRVIWEHREQPNKVTEIIKFKWMLIVVSKWCLELTLDVLHMVVQKDTKEQSIS